MRQKWGIGRNLDPPMNPSMRRSGCALRHETYASGMSRLAKFQPSRTRE
jgi:hypothetical protein